MNLVYFSSSDLMSFVLYRVDIPRRYLTPHLVLSQFHINERKLIRLVAQRCVNHLLADDLPCMYYHSLSGTPGKVLSPHKVNNGGQDWYDALATIVPRNRSK